MGGMDSVVIDLSVIPAEDEPDVCPWIAFFTPESAEKIEELRAWLRGEGEWPPV